MPCKCDLHLKADSVACYLANVITCFSGNIFKKKKTAPVYLCGTDDELEHSAN